MKRYDRETKKYISEEEYIAKYNKREQCKGGREHDYVEVLPWGAEADERYKGDTKPYYDALLALRLFEQEQYDLLETHGIIMKHRTHWYSKSRPFVCAVCSKRTTKEVKN